MKERPILMNAEMVRAVLDDRKTQTRRVIKGLTDSVAKIARCPFNGNWIVYGMDSIECPYGKPGDRLWVREACCIAPKRFATPDDSCIDDNDGDPRYVSYRANSECEEAMRDYGLKWTPSIHMPRWASRINLEITEVRVERVQDISEDDAKAEGRAMTTEEDQCDKYVENPDYSYCAKCGGTGLYDGLGANLGVIPDCDCMECNTYKGLFQSLWDSINANRKDKDGNLLKYSWQDNPYVWAVSFKKV